MYPMTSKAEDVGRKGPIGGVGDASSHGAVHALWDISTFTT